LGKANRIPCLGGANQSIQTQSASKEFAGNPQKLPIATSVNLGNTCRSAGISGG
jgi:hypothetical protein